MMKVRGAVAFGVIAACVAGRLDGQGLGRVLGRIKVAVPGLSDFIEPAPLTAGLETAVSGIGIAVLDMIDVRFSSASALARDADGVLSLKPGAWELVSESVGLLPGSTAPVRAEGFVLAPMAGPRAALLEAVLKRAYRAPEIPLADVQSVVWAIASRARMSTLAPAFRNAADRLLTTDERASLDASALGLLPDELRADVRAKLPPALAAIVLAESDLRQAFADPAATVGDLTRISVTSGEPESIMGDRDLLVERWSYHQDGYFARFVPATLQKTAVHVVVPTGRRPVIERDRAGRIARVAYPGGLEIAAEYDDTLSALNLSGDAGVRGYLFKTLRVSEPDPARPGERRASTLRDVGWTLVGMPNSTPDSVAVFSTAGATAGAAPGSDPLATNPRYVDASDHYDVGTWVRRGLGYVGGDLNASGMLDVDPDAIDETYFRDAAGRAVATGFDTTQWARAAVPRLPQTFDWVYCAMPGHACPRANETPAAAPTPLRFDPTAVVAVPGRQGSQRLGFTGRVVR